jgi:site-specific DNA-adenine methylase
MKSPIKDKAREFRCLGALKKKIPPGTVVHSFLLYGGSLEFNLAEDRRFVCAHANRQTVYDFWECMLQDPQRIYEIVTGGALQMGGDDMFHLLQESWSTYADPYLRSSLFFVLNRCSPEGTISAGKLDTKNFHPIALSYLQNFKVPNFHLRLHEDNDTFERLPRSTGADYLLFPVGNFTFNLFDTGKSRGQETTLVHHRKLAKQLREIKEQKWVVIYKTHPELFKLYQGSNITMLNEYGRPTTNNNQCAEMLIANF